MRIGFIIYGSLDTLTGGYLYDKIVVNGLTKLGHEVEVISLPSGSYLQRILYGFSPGIHRRLLSGTFDILLQDELCHPSLFFINKRLRAQAGPTIVAIVHHALSKEIRDWLQNKLLAMIERWYLSSVDGFIHNSETTQRAVTSLVEHNRPQIVAYPAGDRFGNPLESSIIRKRAHREGPLELLFLGNVIPRKGLLPLLEALAAVDSKLWNLSIVGGLEFDPAYTSKARQLVGLLGLSDSVHFLGSLQENELIETLNSSHLFCMPYAYEGFGIAILEAMAFGLPCIGCTNGAASETIRHGVNGFLLAPGDHVGLEPLLTELNQNRERLVDLSLTAKETYTKSPSWDDAVKTIESFLLKI